MKKVKKIKEENDDIVRKIAKDKKEKRKLPKEVENRINKRLFSNIMIAVVIMIYFILLSLGNVNIEQPAFVVDLKVFSITFLVLAVIIFEKSYKKDDGALCIYGIETLVLAIVTLLSVYVNLLVHDKFIGLISIASLLFAIYYVVKATFIYIRDKKAYIKDQNDISEIIKPEEPKKVETRLKKSEMEKIKETKKEKEEEHKESIRDKMLKALNRKPNKEKTKVEQEPKKEEKIEIVEKKVEIEETEPTEEKKIEEPKKTQTKKSTTKSKTTTKKATAKDADTKKTTTKKTGTTTKTTKKETTTKKTEITKKTTPKKPTTKKQPAKPKTETKKEEKKEI